MDVLIKKILKNKDKHVTLLEVISEYIEREGIEISDIAEKIKSDKTLFKILKAECEQRNLIKGKRVSQDLDEILDQLEMSNEVKIL